MTILREKKEIILRNRHLCTTGILTENDIQKKPSISICPQCSLVNALDNKYCSKCSYRLSPSAFRDQSSRRDENTIVAGKVRTGYESYTLRDGR